MKMNKTTQNIYHSWYETVLLLNKEYPSTPIVKALDQFTTEDIKHLIWLLNEELNTR